MSSPQEIMERLRTGRLPPYGSLRWDGEAGDIITSVNFEMDRSEPVAVVCERAHRFFAQLSAAEWRVLDIEIVTRGGKPVRATLKPLNREIVTTGRLRELQSNLS